MFVCCIRMYVGKVLRKEKEEKEPKKKKKEKNNNSPPTKVGLILHTYTDHKKERWSLIKVIF